MEVVCDLVANVVAPSNRPVNGEVLRLPCGSLIVLEELDTVLRPLADDTIEAKDAAAASVEVEVVLGIGPEPAGL